MLFPTNEKLQIFNMVDFGFDVWTCAFRGPEYNQGHVSLSPTSYEYWDFSLNEQGLYDMPAAVDYIHKQGNGQKIYMFTSSVAASIMWIALENDQDFYAERVEKIICG